MRIALVNWSAIWDGPVGGGGGVGGYVQALAHELTLQGHEVHHISSGRLYGHNERIRSSHWLGVRVHELADSPVPAPSLACFASPERETDSPELVERFSTLIESIAPDAVHIHSLEGLSAPCVAAAARHAPVLFSLHNHHTLCPQVYLLRGHVEPCLSADGGRACEGCVPARTAGEVIAERLADSTPAQAPSRWPALRAIRDELVGLLNPTNWSKPQAATDPFEPPETEATRLLLAELEPQRPHEPGVRLPVLPPDEPAPDQSERYGRRRAAMIDALNSADAVHAVSGFVANLYAARGVDRAKIRTETIGSRMVRIAERQRDMVFDPPTFAEDPSRPIRLVYLGSGLWAKGLHVLAEAFDAMPAEVLARYELTVYASGAEHVTPRFRQFKPRLAGLTLGGAYTPHDVPWILGGKDLGIVPSIWWDNGPQVVHEMQACRLPIIGSEAGGIPSMVTDGTNGRLFPAGDRDALASILTELAAGPAPIDRWRAHVQPPPSIESHAELMAGWYADVAARRNTP